MEGITLPKISIDPTRDIDMCFVCGKSNPIGLKLKFRQEGKKTIADFTPTSLHQGWSNIVHGAIILALLDEGMSWAAIYEGLVTITAKMENRWRRPAKVGEPLVISASITRNTRRLIEAEAAVSLKDGTVVAEGTALMYVVGRIMEVKPEKNA